jgi:N-acetylglutamate synthase-like GNAT family acetyltransferase
MDIEIRDAASEDAAALAVLLDQLGYPSTQAEVARRLANLASTGSDECLVALRNGEVVGMAAVHVSATLVDDNLVAKLSAIVVDRRYRRLGIGEALLSAVEQRARKIGCSLIFLTTADRRDGAHAFYRRIGFEETGRRFVKLLSPSGGAG